MRRNKLIILLLRVVSSVIYPQSRLLCLGLSVYSSFLAPASRLLPLNSLVQVSTPGFFCRGSHIWAPPSEFLFCPPSVLRPGPSAQGPPSCFFVLDFQADITHEFRALFNPTTFFILFSYFLDKSKKKVITKCPFNKFDHRTKDAIRESMKWKILPTLLHM